MSVDLANWRFAICIMVNCSTLPKSVGSGYRITHSRPTRHNAPAGADQGLSVTFNGGLTPNLTGIRKIAHECLLWLSAPYLSFDRPKQYHCGYATLWTKIQGAKSVRFTSRTMCHQDHNGLRASPL